MVSIIVRSLSEQAYELILARILVGQIAPGMPLRQDAIALQLGVSKIPLREALTRLEQDGLLSSHPNRGFVVRALSAKEAQEVFALRLKLEPDAVAAACLVATPQDRETAKMALDALEQKQGVAPDPDHIALNRAFHLALVRPGAGLITLRTIGGLHVLAERYIHVHLESAGRHADTRAQHRELLGLWLDRQADAAAAVTADHIADTLEILQERLGP